MNQSMKNPIFQLNTIVVLITFTVVVIIAVAIIAIRNQGQRLPECVAGQPIPSGGCIMQIK